MKMFTYDFLMVTKKSSTANPAAQPPLRFWILIVPRFM